MREPSKVSVTLNAKISRRLCVNFRFPFFFFIDICTKIDHKGSEEGGEGRVNKSLMHKLNSRSESRYVARGRARAHYR